MRSLSPLILDTLANSSDVVTSYMNRQGAKSGTITKEHDTYATVEANMRATFTSPVEFAGDDVSSRPGPLAVQQLAGLRPTETGTRSPRESSTQRRV